MTRGDKSEGAKGAAPEERWAKVPYALLAKEHQQQLGAAIWLLIRALGVPRNKGGEAEFSPSWLAREIGCDERRSRRLWQERVVGVYVLDTGRVGRKGWTVWRILEPENWVVPDVRPKDRRNIDDGNEPGTEHPGTECPDPGRSIPGRSVPWVPGRSVPPTPGRSVPTSRTRAELEQPPRAREHAHAREAEPCAAAAARPGNEASELLSQALGDLVDAAPSVEELSSTPTGVIPTPLSPIAAPTLTEEESMAELFAPMPLDIARAWFAWWYPTDRAGLSPPWAMRERHRSVQTLVELWNRLGDERDWRAMFRDVQRAELRSIRGMEAALARIGASRAPRATKARSQALSDGTRCVYAPACARPATSIGPKGKPWCDHHRHEAVEMGAHAESEFEPIGAAGEAPVSDLTRGPSGAPIVQQRAGKPAPAGNGSNRATA